MARSLLAVMLAVSIACTPSQVRTTRNVGIGGLVAGFAVAGTSVGIGASEGDSGLGLALIGLAVGAVVGGLGLVTLVASFVVPEHELYHCTASGPSCFCARDDEDACDTWRAQHGGGHCSQWSSDICAEHAVPN